MSREKGHEQQLVKPEIGGALAGLKTAEELAEGDKYWDQVIPSTYGDLHYNKKRQMRDGKLRWENDDGSVIITVEANSNKIVDIQAHTYS